MLLAIVGYVSSRDDPSHSALYGSLDLTGNSWAFVQDEKQLDERFSPWLQCPMKTPFNTTFQLFFLEF